MISIYDFSFDNFRYVRKSFVLKNIIDFLLSVPLPFYPSFPPKIVLFLQFLQAKSYPTNASGVKALASHFRSEIVLALT